MQKRPARNFISTLLRRSSLGLLFLIFLLTANNCDDEGCVKESREQPISLARLEFGGYTLDLDSGNYDSSSGVSSPDPYIEYRIGKVFGASSLMDYPDLSNGGRSLFDDTNTRHDTNYASYSKYRVFDPLVLTSNTSIDYEVWDEDLGFDDQICGASIALTPGLSLSNHKENCRGTFRISRVEYTPIVNSTAKLTRETCPETDTEPATKECTYKKTNQSGFITFDSFDVEISDGSYDKNTNPLPDPRVRISVLNTDGSYFSDTLPKQQDTSTYTDDSSFTFQFQGELQAVRLSVTVFDVEISGAQEQICSGIGSIYIPFAPYTNMEIECHRGDDSKSTGSSFITIGEISVRDVIESNEELLIDCAYY